jgi:rare lipoprotein A
LATKNTAPPRAAFNRRQWAALLLSAALTACHRQRPRYAKGSAGAPVAIGTVETGVASWYGHPYHGRVAANGEVYDMEKLTAAHRLLPFETWVRVTNLQNEKSVEVRITDRGPFVGGRIIDLSHAAAETIDMIGPGTARVKLKVIRAPANAAPLRFAVQVGSFRDKRNAERLRDRLGQRYGAARVVPRDADTPMWRVLVGTEPSVEAAQALAERMRSEGATKERGFVVRLDSV